MTAVKTMTVTSSARAVTVRAHAKINLDLRVLGTRPDGFHELRTVFQALALHDTIECVPREGPFAIECETAGVPLDRSNLVWRAAEALWRSLRRERIRCATCVVRLRQTDSAAGRARRRQRRCGRDAAGAGARLARAAAANAAHGRGRDARRRRAVLSVRRHGARARHAATRSIRSPICRVTGSSC